MTQLVRAWSTLTLKAAGEDDQRIIEGIATTPETDRIGDVVEPMGAEFDLPIPLLWQHDATQPIGHVTMATASSSGISIAARLANIAQPGRLRDRLEEAWQSIKSGLVRGLSIGFSPVEFKPLEGGGIRFTRWKWLELSAVTIPANQDASIAHVKFIDEDVLDLIERRNGPRPIIRLNEAARLERIEVRSIAGGRNARGADIPISEFNPAPYRRAAARANARDCFEPRDGEPSWDLVDLKRKGRRMVHGLASSKTPNEHDYSLSSDGCFYQLPVPLLCSHGRGRHERGIEETRIGEVVWACKTERGVFVRAILDDSEAADYAWQLVMAGELKALSTAMVSGSPETKVKGVVDGITFYESWAMKEVSLCRSGANPDCFFTALADEPQ